MGVGVSGIEFEAAAAYDCLAAPENPLDVEAGRQSRARQLQMQPVSGSHGALKFYALDAGRDTRQLERLLGQMNGPVDLRNAWQHRMVGKMAVEPAKPWRDIEFQAPAVGIEALARQDSGCLVGAFVPYRASLGDSFHSVCCSAVSLRMMASTSATVRAF